MTQKSCNGSQRCGIVIFRFRRLRGRWDVRLPAFKARFVRAAGSIRRAEMYAHDSNLLRRKCQLCLQTWPLTDEFFSHSGRGRKYFLKTCRLCYQNLSGTAEVRRKQRLDAYDRHVAVKQISHAKAERDAFLRQHRNFPTRSCFRCHETWELLSKRFPKYKLASGLELYRRTCRFCLRTGARLKERAK